MNFLIKLYFILTFIIFNQAGVSQNLSIPFVSGEKVSYDVFYNWHFVWVKAGKVEFNVKKEVFEGRPVFHFTSNGRSVTTYDWIYKVREQFESIADSKTLAPLSYSRNSHEGDYFAREKINFDYKNLIINTETENSNKPLTLSTLDLKGFVLDVQTAVYYARTLDFSGMYVGEKIPFRMIIDGEIFDLYGKFLGVEIIENYDGQFYRCHKFSALLVKGTIFSGGENLFVWFTDDKNKIPILVEARILVGSVKAVFTGAKNLAFPLTSLVN